MFRFFVCIVVLATLGCGGNRQELPVPPAAKQAVEKGPTYDVALEAQKQCPECGAVDIERADIRESLAYIQEFSPGSPDDSVYRCKKCRSMWSFRDEVDIGWKQLAAPPPSDTPVYPPDPPPSDSSSSSLRP